ncbi:hypothetical protein H6P81_000687 [Aristolochia fimbriata]|uniref:Uncharacterized protein n=1 Tax=Aristolochia fimbriata TaxID=158543 RepID=A0AAV7F5L8_ARIFI|nr:hypothetical protein H6P81_000687 [Aristolochia fimbriata]
MNNEMMVIGVIGCGCGVKNFHPGASGLVVTRLLGCSGMISSVVFYLLNHVLKSFFDCLTGTESGDVFLFGIIIIHSAPGDSGWISM